MYEQLHSEFRNFFLDKVRVELEFDLEKGSLDNAHIIFANYDQEDYSGYAYVLFAENDQLFEVHGDHCSCYGLEGQWYPEPVTIEFLEKRIADKSYFHLGFSTHEYTKLCEDIRHAREGKLTNDISNSIQ